MFHWDHGSPLLILPQCQVQRRWGGLSENFWEGQGEPELLGGASLACFGLWAMTLDLLALLALLSL